MVWRTRPEGDGHRTESPLPWVSVDEVRHSLATIAAEERRHWIVIAIGVVAADADEAEALARRLGIEVDLEVRPGWEFLGYDVTDTDCSGLSNCGYDPNDLPSLANVRSWWGPKLNTHGLFPELADALAFRLLTDRRVPEHAPFFVYGIWMVG